jgi:8-oxo-dGTP pyrophosphatase MutT (NUDIX family)
MSDPTPIPRWLDPSEYSPADHLKAIRGERPENPEYLKARREVLEEAGFNADEGDRSTSEHEGSNPDDLVTSGEYLRRIQKGK